MENEKEVIENIERYVFEENKTVTYKWLSRHHNIHVNISKKYLSTFISNTNEKLSVSYLIGGVLRDGSHKIVVGWQQDISDVKQSFKDITSEHVYSVQKNVENGDLKAILYSADCSSTEESGSTQSCSSIKCNESNLRDTSAVAELKRKALIASKSKSSEIVTKTSTVGKKTPEKLKKDSTSKTKESVISNGTTKIESSSPKKSAIAAMFAAQKETKKTENKAKVEQQPAKGKPKGLAAFFNPSNANKKNDKLQEKEKVTSPVNDKENRKTEEEVPEKKPLDKVKDDSLKEKIDDNPKTKETSKTKVVKKTGKKRKKTKDEDTQGKKRKRIVMMSDSESGEEEGYRSPSPEQREPTPPPPVSDDEDVIPATPQVGKKSKKKKLVEKTFLDSDGFLVTNKEYTMVSDSEEEIIDTKSTSSQKPSEIENPVKKEEKIKVQEPKKKASPQKAKQSSITSFFKKS